MGEASQRLRHARHVGVAGGGIARSTLCDELPAATDDTAIAEAMSKICEEFERYGWRRVRAALRQRGMVVNHKKVRRIMREHGLQPRMRRGYTTTTDSDHDQPIFADLAKDMKPDGPDQLWVADITYVPIIGGFVYVAIVLDAWSRRVVGYALIRHGQIQRKVEATPLRPSDKLVSRRAGTVRSEPGTASSSCQHQRRAPIRSSKTPPDGSRHHGSGRLSWPRRLRTLAGSAESP